MKSKLFQCATVMLCLASIVTTVACGSDRYVHVWTGEVLEATSKKDDGEFAEARRAYERLLEEPPDEERRRWLLFELADLAREEGKADEALRRYEEIYEEDRRDLYGAKALFAAAQLVEERQGPDAARPLYRRVITRYPDEVPAEKALHTIIEHYEVREKPEALLEELAALYDSVAGSYLSDNVLFFQGRYLEEKVDRPEAALESYAEIVEEHPESGLADDAMWQMASIHRRNQDWAAAVRILDRLTTDIEESWFVGSYNSVWVDDGLYELGMIHMLFLDDYDAAVQYFERYVEEFPHTMRTDDAAWAIVEIRRLQGDEMAQIAALKKFLKNFPESRHAPSAEGRLGIGGGGVGGGRDSR